MAKIDDSVKKKVPELRFKGFTDDWEERKLGEFSDVRDGTHASPKYVSQGHPMVTSKNLTHSGLDMTDVSFLTDKDFNEINKRSKVSIGDILFGMIGTIGNPVIVDRDDFAIKNVALIKEKTSNPITNKWLLQYLKSPSFNRFIQKENAGGTQKFIALGLIRDMKLRVPEFEEQQKIGAFFKKIDDTIALHQRKLDLLKEQKKGFLQKMFPKNGAKVPELRFAGFADDWEERKLSDVANHRGGTAIEKYFDKDGVYKVISIGSYGLNSQYVDQNIRAISNEITDGRVVNSGELTMVLNDKTANGTIIGRTLLVEKDNEYVINQRTEIISPKENFDSNFAYTTLNGPFREKVKRIVQGGTQIYVNYPAVSNLNLELPKIEEQQKIGSFFKQLDDTIALHQHKLDLLKEQKKGFLQKMFV
ncbi:restriction endonuclease subunit S (plasmid) [Lactococcus petauri]|uniref:restriction endonuclease subunit S n=1 Tax=Lactococcus petauri TaxID=1940789 RepID=UPI0030D547DE